jgi:hypothetical protein
MSELKQEAPSQKQKTSQAKPAPAAVNAPVVGLEYLGVQEEYLAKSAFGAGSLLSQAARLGDRRLHRAQRRVVAKQVGQTQGNQHLQRLIASTAGRETFPVPKVQAMGYQVARQDTPEREVKSGLDASLLLAVITKPINAGGQVTTRKEGEGEKAIVKVTSPQITFSAGVSLAAGVKLGEDSRYIKIGTVQTLVSSNRVGVYKKGEQVVAEYANTMSMARDTMQFAYGAGEERFAAEPPFYDRPKTISDQHPSEFIDFKDQPGFGLPLEFGGGRLAAVKGSDHFNTSIGAKRDNTIITLNPFGWEVNWDATLDADFNVANDAEGKTTAHGIKTFEEKTGIVMDVGPSTLDLAKGMQPAFTFTSVEAAMNESAIILWLALAASRQRDPASAVFIEEALRKKNPAFRVLLTVDRSATRGWLDSGSTDAIESFAHVTKQSPVKGPYSVAQGKSQAIDFNLNEILDPVSVNAASKLSVWAGGQKESGILGDFVELSYPFLSQGTIVPYKGEKRGEYRIEVTLV